MAYIIFKKVSESISTIYFNMNSIGHYRLEAHKSENGIKPGEIREKLVGQSSIGGASCPTNCIGNSTPVSREKNEKSRLPFYGLRERKIVDVTIMNGNIYRMFVH